MGSEQPGLWKVSLPMAGDGNRMIKAPSSPISPGFWDWSEMGNGPEGLSALGPAGRDLTLGVSPGGGKPGQGRAGPGGAPLSPLSPAVPAGKELVLFLRPLSQSCEPGCLGQDLEMQDILGDCECCGQSRFSVLSTDSGIERDLPAPEEPCAPPCAPCAPPCAPCAADAERSRLHRKGGIKKKLSPLDGVALLQAKPPGKPPRGSGTPPVQRLHTARLVLLGDDRILGRLAQAFHSLRYPRLWGQRRARLLCPWGRGSSRGGWGRGWV